MRSPQAHPTSCIVYKPDYSLFIGEKSNAIFIRLSIPVVAGVSSLIKEIHKPCATRVILRA